LAKIAVESGQAVSRRIPAAAPGEPPSSRLVAQGDGWRVADVVCTAGPRSRPYEEQHSDVSIAMVVAGSFQYRAGSAAGPGRELMTPGSVMLGNPGQFFECGHEHSTGDRCLAFWYSPECFENIAADAGRIRRPEFHALRLPPLREISPLLARASAGLTAPQDASWEEISLQLAAQAVQLAGGRSPAPEYPQPSAVARVTRTLRMIERLLAEGGSAGLGSLAREAGLSPYHYLRTFERLTGLTPHQYVLRARLREAARRLVTGQARILDVALDCGFGDVSNFNRAFRGEFGVSPRAFRSENKSKRSAANQRE
jgi:AraC family transcriptional regulator